MKSPGLFAHIRDIILLPFTVTFVIPYIIYSPGNGIFPNELPLQLVGLIFVLPGLFFLAYTVSLFSKKGKGTLAPWNATQKLVVSGPYMYCRNPMITGVLSILLGEAVLFNSRDILFWAFIFFIINNIYFILKEEPDLYKRFGEEYLDYKRSVPRWLPKLKPYKKKEMPE